MEKQKMNEEKRYIDSLLSDGKYLNELLKMYEELKQVRRFKRKLDEIEKEITWYVGNEKNCYLPDYSGFYAYAHENYIPKQNESMVQSKYKELLGEYNADVIPGYVYCMALLGYFAIEERKFLEEHGDCEKPTEMQIKYFNVLHSKFKLLAGFLEQFDALVAIFINSIDMKELMYLDDDIKNADSRAIKHRFMAAIRKRDKSMAFKLLGRMRELDEGEDYYFEALSHYINEEYEEAIRYINKVEENNIDYPSAIALKLECCALLGDWSNFIKCVSDNRSMTFEYWHIVFLLMSLTLRAVPDNDDFGESDTNILEKIKYSEEESPYYVGQVHRLVANIMLEAFEIIETANAFSAVIDNFDMPVEKQQRLEMLQMALMFFRENFVMYLDFEYLKDRNLEDVKQEVEAKLLKLLIDNNPERSFENIRMAFLMQLRLGNTKAFINNVCSNYDVLLAYSEKGEAGAEELLRLAYIESAIQCTIDKKIKEHIENNAGEDLSQSISDKKLLKVLSEQGRIAYESAEWQYQKSQEDDYGWKDAGMISLGFYRILEVELNQKFIIPLLSGIGFESLNNEFLSCANAFTGDDKKRFKNKWGTIIKTYQGMEESDFTGNGFMLGVLDHFFKAIGSEYEEDDSLATLIRNHLGDVLNSYGEEKFAENFFEDITNDSTRNKFRNPPAHTRYLPYSVACECREVFRKTILQMGDMLK